MNTHPGSPRVRPFPPLAQRIGAVVTAIALATGAGALTAGPASAATTSLRSTDAATAAAPATTGAATEVGLAASAPSFDDGKYIVTLRDAAVSAYTGGLDAFDATRPTARGDLDVRATRVVDYSRYLTGRQQQVADSVDAAITSAYTITTNGFSSTLTAEQAATLAADPRVAAVVPDELLHLQATPSTDFLGLSGDDGVWAETGGVESAGEGTVVGIIDSGISPENASFAGDPLGTSAGDAPYLDGDDVVFEKADGTTFRGECVTGPGFDAGDCSTKLITARYFVDSYTAGAVGEHDFISPRDGSGHGSHTSSTAAGDADVAASVAGRDFGRISGVVPGAKIAMYKACWSGATHDDDGCQTGDLLAAIDAAVADGVDVINYSIGGGAAQTTVSLTDEAFLNAATAGVFVAASAGNDGAKASTADNAAPWITTVAATTIPSYEATVRLGDGQVVLGGSITVPADDPLSGSLIAAADAAVEGAETPELCGPGVLDPTKVSGKIVLCDRGVVDRTAKSAEVERAGGIGVVLVNPTASSIDLDTHVLPTVHVDAFAFDALHAYAATEGATVTLEDGNTAGLPSPVTPQVAGFSSRGPILADGGDLLKPDIAAPGVAILAAFSSEPGEPGDYALLSGTSMASPHIAGLAALYLGEHPDASPSEIKSAMMTTSYDTVDAEGEPATDPFAQGAGHVDPTRYFDPGMLYLNGVDDWYGYIETIAKVDLGVDAIDPSDLNLPSISVGGLAGSQTVTRTVTSTRAGDYTVTVPELAGVDTVVSPSTLSFGAAGEEQQYTVTFTRTDAPVDEFVTGQLIWRSTTDPADSATTPVAVRPVALDVPEVAVGEGAAGSLEIPVSVGSTESYDITKTGLVKGQVVHGTGTAGPLDEPVRFDRHVIDVPQGTTLAHIVLDGADDGSDLDLHLSSLSAEQGLIPWADATTSSAHEVIDFGGLPAGRYVLDVDFFSGTGDLDYTLTSYLLGTSTNEGALTVSPTTLETTLGEPASVGVSWSGLEAGGSYYGQVDFGSTGHHTAVQIAVPGVAPAPPAAEPSLGFDRAWALAGAVVEVDIEGLAAGEPYTVTLDDAPVLTGLADDDGTARRGLQLSADIAVGDHAVRLTSSGAAAASVDASLHVTDLVLIDAYEQFDYDSEGTPLSYLNMSYAGAGEIRLRVTGSNGEAFTGSYPVTTDEGLGGGTVRTDDMHLTPGVYTAEIAATAPAGVTEQHLSHSFVVSLSEASDITISQNAADPDLADLSYLNRSEQPFVGQLRYKLCTGPVVYARVTVQETGGETHTETFDMHGKTSVELVQDDGAVVAAYLNTAAGRCSGDPVISQDYWMTFSDAATLPANPDAAGEGPISAVVSDRFPAYSGGFELRAGFGGDIEGDYFTLQKLGHEVVTTPGPVVDVPLLVPEDTPVWSRVTYEINDGQMIAQGIRWVKAQPVTLEMLEPVADEPGLPGDPGDGGPGTGGPGTGDPGTGQPGAGQPGASDPGASAPGSDGSDADGDLAATGLTVLPGVLTVVLLLGLGALVLGIRRRFAGARQKS